MAAEPMTPEQVEELKAALYAYEQSRRSPPPEYRGLALGMLVYIAINDLPSILASLDQLEAMKQRMRKEGR